MDRDTHDEIETQVPILVVGAGPCGLTLANLLGTYGAGVLLVERNPSTVREPRAVSIDDESLRIMQAVGLSDEVLKSIVAGYGSDYLTPSGRCFLTVEPTGRPFGFPRRNAFRQPQLEAQLQVGATRFSTVQTVYGSTLDSYQQDEEGVTARILDGQGNIRRIRCQYLVGCDGAGSDVRRQLGLRLQGESFAQRWLIVDLENSPTNRRNTVVFCDSVRPCIALPGPNQTRRFEFKLHPEEREEDILQSGVVDRLLRDHGAHAESVLIRKVVYTFHARVAPRWCVGRVLLAGDAAHLTPPFAGQGMNSGLRDCSNIGWKLAAVIAGRQSRKILLTYEQERRDHVWRMIQLALRMGRIMSPKSRFRGFVVQSAFRAIGLWPAAKSFFGEMKYKPKPKFDTGFMQPDGFRKNRTLVGRMLVQPLVRMPDGKQLLLDELLGSGFALVGINVPAADVGSASEERAIAQLAPACVAINPPAGGKEILRINVVELNRDFAALDPYRGRILLVRPDRYVAASGTSSGRDSIGAAVTSLVARFNH